MNRPLTLALVGALTSLSACGSGTPQPQAPLTPYTASNPTSALATPMTWLPMVDRRSGVHFELPHRRKAVVTPGPPVSWTYTVPVPGGNVDGNTLTVTMAFFGGGIPALPTILDNLTLAAKRSGMPDATALRTHATRVDGVAAQTGALEFTAVTGQKAYWLTTEFVVRGYAVAAQAMSLSDPALIAGRKLQVRQLLRRLVASIRLQS